MPDGLKTVQYMPMKMLSTHLHRLLSSPVCFWVILGLFILQALWLVFSAAYPMAFDEKYHFTYIQLFARQWSPLISQHPAGFDHLGVITQDTSYLYHYLMSFPYRIFAGLTSSQIAQVVFLRLLNLGLFTGGLILFRRLMRRSGLSPALTHLGLLLFTLIPIVPLLGAQINYDNLLMLLVAGMLLLSVTILRGFGGGEFPLKPALALLGVAAVTSVVKTASLPIIVAIIGFLVVYGGWQLRREGTTLISTLRIGWQQLSVITKLGLIALIIIGGGLFMERYGGNWLMYGAIAPECQQVLSIEQCLAFEPFARNVEYTENLDPDFQPDLHRHLSTWTGGMWLRTFYMINGDVEPDRYQNFPAPPLLAFGATIILLGGIGAAIWHWRYVFRRPETLLFLLTALFYIGIIWQQNYTGGYQEHGRVAAANGRYLLPVLPAVIILIGRGYARLLRGRLRLKTALVAAAILIFLQGGGTLSFMLRSHESWFWPHPAVHQLNHGAGELIQPLILSQDLDYMQHIRH